MAVLPKEVRRRNSFTKIKWHHSWKMKERVRTPTSTWITHIQGEGKILLIEKNNLGGIGNQPSSPGRGESSTFRLCRIRIKSTGK